LIIVKICNTVFIAHSAVTLSLSEFKFRTSVCFKWRFDFRKMCINQTGVHRELRSLLTAKLTRHSRGMQTVKYRIFSNLIRTSFCRFLRRKKS